MPVPFVRCQHDVTGAFADLPETAVRHMPGWKPVGEPEDATVSELPEQPTGPVDDTTSGAPSPDTTGETSLPARPAPAKRKAAESAKTPEED